MIVTLRLKPGAVIEEGRLQEELRLGRTPIREALQRLAHENLVSAIPHRGTFVTDINITDLARLTEVRIDLEGCAARLAAERATEDERRIMRDLIGELGGLGEAASDDLIRFDQRIHRIIYQASRNQFLEEVCDRYFNLSVRLWFLFLPRVPLKEAVTEQLELLEAVLGRDPRRAESVLRRHIAGFEEEVRRIL
jgi:DNA-binding GntR family transcriptional regulator